MSEAAAAGLDDTLAALADPLRRRAIELLAKVLQRLVPGDRVPGTWEAPAERDRAIHHELLESKRLIEERTGQEVIHLCYPWHVSGPTARRLAREVGYRTAFGGKVPGTPLTMPGGDPHSIARIGEVAGMAIGDDTAPGSTVAGAVRNVSRRTIATESHSRRARFTATVCEAKSLVNW